MTSSRKITMIPKSLIDDDDNGDKYYKMSHSKNMFTLYQDSQSMNTIKKTFIESHLLSNIYHRKSFTQNHINVAKENMIVYENDLCKNLKLNSLSAKQINEKYFQQILLDSLIHHFILDLDSSEKLILKKSQSPNDIICLGFDDSNPLKKQIIVLDGYTHFVGIKY